ncbi:hypothetical protein RN001_016280 [Aquatica leii]|uniref:Uncharacterized protein n=1 Tax=Aquatica leii TaxID=1421715 RepID=A0AAN7NZ60_9COLE|nr:hypothetical protein RN001_016280 [Aquatica leii]
MEGGLVEKGLFVGRTLVRVKNTMPVRILNINSDPVTLKKKTVVGQCTPVSQIKKEYTPSVITFGKWVEYREECERLKMEKKREKQERKQARESKKQMMAKKGEKLKQKPAKHQKQDIDSGSSSQDLEDWVESGSSGDDIDFTVFEQEDIEIFEPKDLNLGSMLSPTTYRYVAKILEILSSEEYEIQCYKTANDEKTVFDPIENDISTINQCDILGKLPEPTVKDKRIKCKTIFLGQVDISEQI